jgi:hypothetical protein
MKKLLIIGIVAVIAMASLAVGYAMWSKTLFISGTVNTGNLDAVWNVVMTGADTEPPAKNVSWMTCSIDSLDPTILHVDVTGAYPSIDYYCSVNVTSTGSVPVHLKVSDFEWSADGGQTWGPVPAHVDLEIGPFVATPPLPQIADCTQLHQGEAAYGVVFFHFANEAGLDQSGNYKFRSSIMAYQWNEDQQAGQTCP